MVRRDMVQTARGLRGPQNLLIWSSDSFGLIQHISYSPLEDIFIVYTGVGEIEWNFEYIEME